MSFEEPTFEEYRRATDFARFKYKWSLLVLIGCWICLILLCWFVYHYAQELSEHPATYAVKKLDVNYCMCYGNDFLYTINRTDISYQPTNIFGD